MKSRFTELFIAWRYLFSPKSHSVINIISIVTILAVSVPTAAMIIVLSVYNGLDGFIKSMYSSFDTQIAITPESGKFFHQDSIDIRSLYSIDGVEHISCMLEENALLEYKTRQSISTLRGVDSVYLEMMDIDKLIYNGEAKTSLGDLDLAIVGMGVAYSLGVNIVFYDQIEFFVPDMDALNSFMPLNFYRSAKARPTGVFILDEETDSKYTIVSLDFLQNLLGRPGEMTKIGISLKEGISESSAIAKIEQIVGGNFKVSNRYQQKEGLYKVMEAEKLGVYFIIVMILIVASFTLVGAIIMLLAEKEGSIFALSAMGASGNFVNRIFQYQGALISIAGGVVGLFFGVLITLIQQYFGVVKLQGASLLIDSYPVELHMEDVALVVVTVFVVELLISYLTVRAVMKKR